MAQCASIDARLAYEKTQIHESLLEDLQAENERLREELERLKAASKPEEDGGDGDA